jgi:hypothetical protein
MQDGGQNSETSLPPGAVLLERVGQALLSAELLYVPAGGGGWFDENGFRILVVDEPGDTGTIDVELVLDCPSGTVSNVWSDGTACKTCPQGASCLTLGSSPPEALPGFWESDVIDYAFVSCQPVGSCSQASDQFTYNAGYEGRMCGRCAESYYRSNGNCHKCNLWAFWQAVFKFAMPLLNVWLLGKVPSTFWR